ncbi:class I SAM-dependent methyltransferase [Micromonospora sp. WMMD882]|uniref:class I SAM-dependent methyltransferase n=1 Tax=Micromonospora sp. WMMD882 TaxID=3015151 RepID=UPI00248CF8DD|nr:class I SAM-dependent methyltransferase [Micromonospora sp. WMMD882]WBB78170.1 class I SAM-dependent methyltransferase [Micromonospora sp. WMMD882]
MSAPGPTSYGDAWADVYDEWFGELSDTTPAVGVLAGLAAGGVALEVGAGTGRLAVPLARAGGTVIAVESSPRMAGRLRAKAQGLPVRLVVGDVLDADWSAHLPPGGLALAYLSCNTLYQLPDQQAQRRCLARLAADLAVGGRLVVEASMPNLALLAAGRSTSMRVLPDGRVAVTTVRADPAHQRTTTDTVVFDGPRQHVLPVRERYVWPAELDLLAQLVGLGPEQRWSGWERGPFTSTSTGHVTVYRKSSL